MQAFWCQVELLSQRSGLPASQPAQAVAQAWGVTAWTPILIRSRPSKLTDSTAPVHARQAEFINYQVPTENLDKLTKQENRWISKLKCGQSEPLSWGREVMTCLILHCLQKIFKLKHRTSHWIWREAPRLTVHVWHHKHLAAERCCSHPPGRWKSCCAPFIFWHVAAPGSMCRVGGYHWVGFCLKKSQACPTDCAAMPSL